jgi:hypothetical protein
MRGLFALVMWELEIFGRGESKEANARLEEASPFSIRGDGGPGEETPQARTSHE